MISYQSLVKDSGSRFQLDVKVDPKEDTAWIPYSSGTTGYPKGVKLSHYNMSANVVQMTCTQAFDKFYHAGNLLAALPLFHATGVNVTMLCGLHEGSSIIMMPKFVPELFLSFIERYKIAGVTLVPPLLLFLANHPMVDEHNLSSLKHITYGAAPLGVELAVKVKNRLNLHQLQQGYGMTEAGVTHIAPVDTVRPGSVGVPLSRISCKIVDIDTGASVGPNCQGEIVVQGPQVCSLHTLVYSFLLPYSIYIDLSLCKRNTTSGKFGSPQA